MCTTSILIFFKLPQGSAQREIFDLIQKKMDEAEPVPNSSPEELSMVTAPDCTASSSASYAGPPALGNEKLITGTSNFGSGTASKRPHAKRTTKSGPSRESSMASSAGPGAKLSRKKMRGGGGTVGNHTLDSFFDATSSKESGSASAFPASSCVGHVSGSESDEGESVEFELDPDVRAILQSIQREEEQNLQLNCDRREAGEPWSGECEMTEEEADKLCLQVDLDEVLDQVISDNAFSPPAIPTKPLTAASRRSHISLAIFAHPDSEDESVSLNDSPLPTTRSQRSDATLSVSFNASPVSFTRSKPSQIVSDVISLDDSDVE